MSTRALQKAGIAKALAAGKRRGRFPTARSQSAEVLRLKAEGMKPADITKKLGISPASYFRIIAAEAKAA